MKDIILTKLYNDPIYKFSVVVDNKKIKFGRKPYLDFLQHKDSERRNRYIARHQHNENWTKTGLKTKGFWSRHLLWGDSPNIMQAIKDIENKFNVNIKYI